MTASYKQTRKQLQRDIVLAKAETPLDTQKVNCLEVDLKILDSDRLRERARRWDFDLYGSEVGSWQTHSDGHNYLGQHAQYELAEKLIRDAKYRWFKKWTDLLIPIASLVISLVALIIAILALRS